MCLRGRALAARGAAGDGLELMTGGAAICRATGAGLAIAYYSSYIGEAHLVANNVPEGLAAVTEGLAAAEHEEHFYTADLYRFRGTLLAASHAASEEVEAAFRSAIGIASRQGSRVLALRAATAFAEYLRARGRDAEAQQMLDGLEDTFSHKAGSASA